MIYIFIQHLIDRLLPKTRKFWYFLTYPVCIKLYSLVDQAKIWFTVWWNNKFWFISYVCKQISQGVLEIMFLKPEPLKLSQIPWNILVLSRKYQSTVFHGLSTWDQKILVSIFSSDRDERFIIHKFWSQVSDIFLGLLWFLFFSLHIQCIWYL